MSKITPRAIFIGDARVGSALAGFKKEWEFLDSVDTVKQFWDGINNGDISTNIQIILMLDLLFDPKGEDTQFESLVAAMSPHCFFGIVNYHSNLNNQIKERVEYEAYSSGNSDSALFFFIDPQAPKRTLDRSIQEFSEKTHAIEAANIILGRDITENNLNDQDHQVGDAHSSLGEIDEEKSDYLGQIVAVTSSKGGSGKSTVSTTLAAYLAYSSEAAARKGIEKRPLKVLIIDLDIRDGQLGFLTGFTKPTVINLRMNGITEQTISESIIKCDSLKVDLLLAPKRPRTSEDTPPEFYIELIQELRKRYDYILLDTSVNYLDPLLEKVAYPVADQIVFVTDIVVNSVLSMTRWISEVTRTKAQQNGMGINPNKIGIVVNKALADVNMSSEKIETSAMGLPILTVIPSNPKLVAHSANMQSLEFLLQHPEIRKSIRRLARALVGSRYQLSDDF